MAIAEQEEIRKRNLVSVFFFCFACGVLIISLFQNNKERIKLFIIMTVFCGFGGFAVVVVVNQIPMEAAPVRNGITIKSRKEKKENS